MGTVLATLVVWVGATASHGFRSLPILGPSPYVGTIVADPPDDQKVRRTDIGNDGPFDPGLHALPDLLGYQIGRWNPASPAADLFTGVWFATGGFVRLDIAFAGVVNPPGELDPWGGPYFPYAFGPNPVYGFIEFDVDNDVWTGGETVAHRHRYLANASRFIGKPSAPRFADRFALTGQDIYLPFGVPPFVQRSGEEFHIALTGADIWQIVPLVDDSDSEFEHGESWIVRGPLLHRAHGYEEFSFANGPPPGAYMPVVDLKWEHLPSEDMTFISLVYPLTQAAAAAMTGGSPEPPNGSTTDQHSVFEALDDLIFSVEALPPNHPLRLDEEFPIIEGWEGRQAFPYLESHQWDVTVLVGSAYPLPDPDGALFIWTDISEDPLPGDVTGDGVVDEADEAAINAFIVDRDGVSGQDAGPPGDGQVNLPNFSKSFSVCDLNYDGVVNGLDAALVPMMGDVDADGDVDGDDAVLFTIALVDPGSLNPPEIFETILARGDFNPDGLLDGADIDGFVRVLAGS